MTGKGRVLQDGRLQTAAPRRVRSRERPNGHIVVTLRVYQEDDQYVAECDELGVASCGASLDEAFRNIKDAVLVHLNGLEAVGELQRFFDRRGIEIRTGQPRREEQVSLRASPDEYVAPFSRPVTIPS